MISPTQENILTALSFLSSGLPHQEWFAILCAIKDALGEDGRDIAEAWSQKGQTYNVVDFRSSWKSAKAGGKTTIATLWKMALDQGWKPGDDSHQETEAERLEREQRVKAEAEQAAKKKAQAERKAAANATKLFKAGIFPPPDSPYLSRKGVQPVETLAEILIEQAAEHLGYMPKANGKPLAGRVLVVPVKIDGKTSTAELIDPEGRKAAIYGGAKSGGFWATQALPKGTGTGLTLAIGEGVATVLSCREALECPALAALSAGNLPKVAKAMRDRYPAAALLIVADKGNGLKYAEQAAKATGAALAVPEFTPEQDTAFQEKHGKAPTDFNDLHQIAGLGAVTAQLTRALTGTSGENSSQHQEPQTSDTNGAADPAKASTLSSEPKSNVISIADESPVRLEFERRIEAADNYDHLIAMVPEIQGSALLRPTRRRLLKLIAKRTGTSLETLQELAPESAQSGRGRADGGFMPYREIGNQIFMLDEEGKRPLASFVAHIIEEMIFDDGLNEECVFIIEGRLRDGTPLPRIEVPAAKFTGLGWIPALWGARAVVHAGNSVKDHVRAAIQSLSGDIKRRTVYGHLGWREIDGEYVFLHSAGAIGANGHRTDIEVRPGEGNMRLYAFAADGGGDVAAAIQASLRLLDISSRNPALGVLLLAAVYRAPLGEAAPIDHAIFIHAPTGARKSESKAIAMAHYGRKLTARTFPANFSDTEADLEAKAHAAKDCPFAVDDYKPVGSLTDKNRLAKKADALVRAVGNQGGRGRRTADMKQKAAYFPRGLVMASGEDIPPGQSCRARMATVELGMEDVDNAALTELQEYARSGTLERAMVGYLRWLAPSMAEHKKTLPGFLRAFRDTANREGFAASHPRAADIYASLLLALDMFFQYATETRAITEDERRTRLDHCERTLKELVSAQGELQADQDEVKQFFGLLRSSLNAGLCHFADLLKQGAPIEHPHFWGWREIPGAMDGEEPYRKPQGELIGWVDSVRCFLDPNAAFAAAQELARSTGETLTISQRTLWRRLFDRGLLVEVEKYSGKVRMDPKRVIAGVSRRVLVMARKTIEDGD